MWRLFEKASSPGTFPRAPRGYDCDEVDAYLDDLDEKLKYRIDIDADEVSARVFPIARKGYERGVVHRYLGELAASIRMGTAPRGLSEAER